MERTEWGGRRFFEPVAWCGPSRKRRHDHHHPSSLFPAHVKRGTLTLRVLLGGEMVEIEGDHALMRDLGRELFNSAEPAPKRPGRPGGPVLKPSGQIL